MSKKEKNENFKTETYEKLRDLTCNYRAYLNIAKWSSRVTEIFIIYLICIYLENLVLFGITLLVIIVIAAKMYIVSKNTDKRFESHNTEFFTTLDSYLVALNVENVYTQKIKAIADLRNYILFGYKDKTIVNLKKIATTFVVIGFLYTIGMFNSTSFKVSTSPESHDLVTIYKNIVIIGSIIPICILIAEINHVFDILGETKNEVLRNIDEYVCNLEEEEKEKQNLENFENIISKVFENKIKELELEKQQPKQEEKKELSSDNTPQTVKQINFGCVNINVPKNPFNK